MEYFLLLLVPVLYATWRSFRDNPDKDKGSGDAQRVESEGETACLPGNKLPWEQGSGPVPCSAYRQMLPTMLTMEDVRHNEDWSYGTYQGGHFAFWSDEQGNRLEIVFPSIYSCVLEDLRKVEEIEGKMNSNRIWTSYHNISYDNQEDEARVEMINKVFSKEKTS